MLKWAVVFFLISIFTAFLGLYEIAGLTMDIAQFLIGLFLVIAVILFALGYWGTKKVRKSLS